LEALKFGEGVIGTSKKKKTRRREKKLNNRISKKRNDMFSRRLTPEKDMGQFGENLLKQSLLNIHKITGEGPKRTEFTDYVLKRGEIPQKIKNEGRG